MLALLEVLGILPGEVPTPVGPIAATPQQTVVFQKPQSNITVARGLPLGVAVAPVALDPADLVPYAFDFTAWIGGGRIIQIVSVTISPAASDAGVRIESAPPREPIIGTDGTRVQIWLSVDPASRSDPAFLGRGFLAAITIHIRTDADPYEEIERTGIVIVRQQ